MINGTVFNLQRYSLHDGPGIRTTVFLKGCPARCWWCHNPESQSPLPEIAFSQNLCIACGACRPVCPNLLSRESCSGCGACADACPTGARELVGRVMSVEEAMGSVLKDRFFYEDSGGGVTFSGGEPLSQPQFLKALLAACREEEIHTAVDTAGICAPESLLDIAPLTDLFLFDLKCAAPERHREGTGADHAAILENLERLGRAQARIWIRIPVVPGFNDSVKEMEALAALAARVHGVRQVWLLPYHGSWGAKPARFGLEAAQPAQEAMAPSQESLEHYARLFRDKGLDTRIGGA
ncbi:glycerol/1,2-propanediol dehydratase-activating enzyme, putative [Citrifermentans bemidjiense Bem]|uniref:Glycerol/1,2-propanediol dehydratase-activating enzyme, putative n=1 Tax=Citrifermentans bemidjiense (strain ATCC BAA-1014 / DSM 16622 / JCM 12645 / Bem) TaxID=404380 RepID=B5EGM5_CITBB|nr:glycerol/1,2-propanediol dehydratase-activating enzyme, putative [Citrifermentans bemidjiense Bem]